MMNIGIKLRPHINDRRHFYKFIGHMLAQFPVVYMNSKQLEQLLNIFPLP